MVHIWRYKPDFLESLSLSNPDVDQRDVTSLLLSVKSIKLDMLERITASDDIYVPPINYQQSCRLDGV